MNELRERIPHTWPSSYENYSWNLFLVLLRGQLDASRLRQATTTMKTLLFTVRVRTMFMPAGKSNWYKSYSTYFLELAQPESLCMTMKPQCTQAKVFNGISRMYFPLSERWKENFLSVKKALFSKWFDFRLTDDEEKRTARTASHIFLTMEV